MPLFFTPHLLPQPAAMEEFTFPAIHESALHPRSYQRSRSFSCLEDLKLREELSSAEIYDEEKMDMLWEDFNEDLGQISGHGKAGASGGFDFSKASVLLEGTKRQGSKELFFVKAVRQQRPAVVMILKVFKKLLLVQKSRKKRTASSLYHM